MQARLSKSPFREASYASTALNDFSTKKNQQYFITRLKGAIIKQCNTNDSKCTFKEFMNALRNLKAVFGDEQNCRDLKHIFMKNEDQMKINDIIQCAQYEGSNISTESILFINIQDLKEIISLQSNKQLSQYTNSNVIKTEGDENSKSQTLRRQKTPLALQQSHLTNRSFTTQTNPFNKTTSLYPSQSPYNYIDVQQASTFNQDQENFEQFKKVRLPRPKNVRNEINLRPFTQKDILQNTASSDRNQFTILDRIKLHQVGYHHMLALEKILGELDPENIGIADKEKYAQIVRKHMSKILADDLINEIIDYISDGNYISCSKLTGLLDAYKFVPRFPIKIGKNDSENYKKKMMDHDITVSKQSNVHELFILLIEKLEEKFDKFLKAFKFFDVEYDGQIQYIEFKQTLDKLCLRFRDDEVKELFNFLDKKQDGYLDYEEFCQLVPNKLELEMLDKNGESLSIKTKQIYEKFGDLQNYCLDPYRIIDRSRFKNPKFLDETTDKIGKEIFYSDKLKKIIENNIVMRKGRCDPGSVLRHGYDIPSDTNQNFAYGVKTKHSENMFDIINNNYGKEWTMDLEAKRQQKEMMLTQLKQKKQSKNTYTNLLRQLHNTQCFNEESRSLPRVKRLAEQNQLKPMFEKTFSDIKKRNNSALFQNNIETWTDTHSNIGQMMRELKSPNSCVNKTEAIPTTAKIEIYPKRAKSTLKNPTLVLPRNISPSPVSALNKTFTCQ